MGCGDEGDSDTDDNGASMTDMVMGDDMTDGDMSTDPDPPVEEPVSTVSYQDDILPILSESCAVAGCHTAPVQGGLNLSSYDTFQTGGVSGAAFVANDGKGSLIVKRIDGSQAPQMPPGGNPLNGEQIQLFIDWIDEGAENN